VNEPDASRDSAAARLGGLLDSAMDGIISVDAGQRIVLYNRAAERIFGWRADQVMGQRLEMLIPDRFRAGHEAQVRQFGQTGTTSRRMGGRTVVHGLRADGEEFPIDASISQLHTSEGTLFTVILRDVTERVRAQEDLASFAAEASGVREQEKSRIARELHDELAQSLTALKMDTIWVRQHLQDDPAGAAEKLSQMLAMLDASVAATRRISSDLRPLVLDDLGLMPAIEWAVQNFSQRTGVPCALEADEALELQEPYATAVFRIVQESLANVGKHARAGHAWVRVAREGDAMVLEVRDDGAGFDTAGRRKPQSLGLVGLRERAHLLKGEVRVTSAPGRGTTVRARIPVGAVA
jgi:PAS domain S-box-containing protein